MVKNRHNISILLLTCHFLLLVELLYSYFIASISHRYKIFYVRRHSAKFFTVPNKSVAQEVLGGADLRAAHTIADEHEHLLGRGRFLGGGAAQHAQRQDQGAAECQYPFHCVFLPFFILFFLPTMRIRHVRQIRVWGWQRAG